MPAFGKCRRSGESPNRRSGTPAVLVLLLLGLFLPACWGAGAPIPLSPTFPPSPTPSPPPTPTPTPLPPIPLRIRFPSTVSALDEVFVVVEAPGLPERDPSAVLTATLYPPGWREPFWESVLDPEDGGEGVYRSRRPVTLPLEPVPGTWRLEIAVRTGAAVRGYRWVPFVQRPLAFWDLAQLGLGQVSLRVPQEIPLVRREGDEVSGVLVWEWRGARLELWWTPGPTKRLTWDTALMMAEATYPVTGGVGVGEPVEGVWKGRRGFRFAERWPEGEAKVLLLQGADYRLYLLRLRGTGKEPVPALFEQIRETFRVD